MIYLKGDEIKLNTGEKAEVLEAWGVAREWYKAKTSDGKIVYVMSDDIESLVRRYSNKRKSWRAK